MTILAREIAQVGYNKTEPYHDKQQFQLIYNFMLIDKPKTICFSVEIEARLWSQEPSVLGTVTNQRFLSTPEIPNRISECPRKAMLFCEYAENRRQEIAAFRVQISRRFLSFDIRSKILVAEFAGVKPRRNVTSGNCLSTDLLQAV